MNKNKEYIITNIIFKKKEIIIHFENQDELSLYPTVYSEFYLYAGKTILEEEMKEIKFANKRAKYFDIAYHLVARKEYSSLLLKRKLIEKGVPSLDTTFIVNKLKEQHLIDDQRYAMDLIETLEIKLYGKNYIIKKLLECGIDEGYILSLSFENEEEKIDKLIINLLKKRSKESFASLKRNIFQDLLLKGYDSELVKEKLDYIKDFDEDQELLKCQKEYEKYLRIYGPKYKGNEISKRIITSLMRKGFSYDIIKKVMEVGSYDLD